MKKYIFILFTLSLISCKHEAEFYIDGKPYYTSERCTKTESETKFGPHYGYNFMSGKYEYHLGSYTESVCVESVIDTIEIKN